MLEFSDVVFLVEQINDFWSFYNVTSIKYWLVEQINKKMFYGRP